MIYFVQDSKTWAIKIGFTDGDPNTRAASLQTGNAAKLVLLATMPGDRSVEAALHRQFADARLAGEWFNPVPELLRAVLECKWREGLSRGIHVMPKHADRPYALWLIEAEEAGDSSGGYCDFYALTDDDVILPNVAAAWTAVGPGDHLLYRVNAVRLVDTVSPQSQYGARVHDQRTRTSSPASLGVPVSDPDRMAAPSCVLCSGTGEIERGEGDHNPYEWCADCSPNAGFPWPNERT